MINLQRLVPAIPLTKVEALKHPGKLIAIFRYILRSFEYMGDKYRRERLKKATFIGRKTLKSVTALHTTLKVIVPSFGQLRYNVEVMLDDLGQSHSPEATEEILFSSNQLLSNIKAIQVNFHIATTFYSAAESWRKYIKTSAAHGNSTIQTVDKLAAILKDNKKVVVSLQEQANKLVEQAEKAQETIINVELSVEQKVQSLTCMTLPYSYQLDALTKFGQAALLLCTQLQPLVQADMRFYFAFERIIEPPTIGENGTSFIVIEPPIAHFEPAGDCTIDPPITVARIPKKFALLPLPGFQWRFVKVDGANINPFTRVGSVANRTFRTTAASFNSVLDFSKVKETKHVRT
jgi:hypothetical protein